MGEAGGSGQASAGARDCVHPGSINGVVLARKLWSVWGRSKLIQTTHWSPLCPVPHSAALSVGRQSRPYGVELGEEVERGYGSLAVGRLRQLS